MLGPLTVRTSAATGPVVGARRRALLAVLLACRGRTVSTDDLLDSLWPLGPPPSAHHTLHTHVSRLRQQLGVPVESRDGGYVLTVPADQVDAAVFDAALDRASGCGPQEATVLLSEALALWRGPAYGSCADLPLVRGEAQRLEERRTQAREALALHLVGAGRAADAVAAAAALTGELPARETAWVALVTALTAAGRPAEGAEAYHRAATALDELGLLPSAGLRAAHAEALGAYRRTAVRAPRPGPGRTASTIPVPASSLVGRERDAEAASALLDTARLVTLVGPGGVGKTRLALEVARRCAPRHASGGRVVELTTLTDPGSVPAAVLAALGVANLAGPAEPALERAGALDLLVVLDNCEHVIDAVADVLEHLLAGSRTRVLATSRERIGLAGEHVRVVEPLGTEGSEPAARQLFLDRALQAGASLADLDPDLVDRIVRRLDGLPLAIEMAAARTATLRLTDLARGLEQELDAEVGRLSNPRRRADERHRTLRTVIAWSEEVLEPVEREALVRWPVFAGAVDPQDAAAVIGATSETVESLVRRSLLVLSPTPEPGRSRYRMLRTVAAALQADRRVPDEARDRHGDHFAEVAEWVDAALRGPDEAGAVTRATTVMAELRAAHAWSRRRDPRTAVRISRALHTTAVATMDDEVLDWAAHLVPLLDARPGSSTAHAGVAARLAKAGDLAAAMRRAALALELADDDLERLHALDVLTDVPIYDGRFEECRHNATRLWDLATKVQDQTYLTAGAMGHALAAVYSGDPDGAREDLHRRRGAMAQFDLAPSSLGWLEYGAGEIEVEVDPPLALAHLQRAMALADEVGNQYLGGVARVSATSLQARHGEPTEAAPAFAAVVRWWLDHGDRTHLETTLRNLVDLLLRLDLDVAAAELWGSVGSGTVSQSFGPERDRLDAARDVLERRLGTRFADAVGVGAGRGVESAARAALDALATG